jgi:uncharacterized cupin superfamily protein
MVVDGEELEGDTETIYHTPLSPGRFSGFQVGLSCTWEIKKALKKCYSYD